MEDEAKMAALIVEFRDLPELNRSVQALREAIRRAARAGDELASECYNEDPAKLLRNLHDAFLFRMTFPERGTKPPAL